MPNVQRKRIATSSAAITHKTMQLEISRCLKQIDAEKKLIEKACGLSFSDEGWQRILTSVSVYGKALAYEKTSIKTHVVHNKLKKIRRNCIDLLVAIEGDSQNKVASRAKIEAALTWDKRDWRKRCKKIAKAKNTSGRAGNNVWNLLCLSVAGVNRFEKRVSTTNSQTFYTGVAWKKWIYLICLIAKQEGHSVKIRKDGLGKQSSIVLLVDELQKKLPPKMTRVFADERSFGSAISGVWQKYRARGLSFEVVLKTDFRYWNPTSGRWDLSAKGR